MCSVSHLAFGILLICLSIDRTSADRILDHGEISFNPSPPQGLTIGQTHTIYVTHCFNDTNSLNETSISYLYIYPDELNAAECTVSAKIHLEKMSFFSTDLNQLNCSSTPTGGATYGNFSIMCNKLGRSTLTITDCHSNDNISNSAPSCQHLSSAYSIAAIRQSEPIDDIFYYILIIFLIINNFLFGCSIEVDTIKEVLKHPVSPIIGMVFQLALLCPMAFAFSHILSLPASLGFGLVAHAASPGGGQSNNWTFHVGGDYPLSILMSMCSTLLSLGTAPLWLLTLGKFLLPANISIPVEQMLLNLSFLVLPLLSGFLLRKFKATLGENIAKALRPVAILYTLLLLTVGIYTYRYVFYLWTEDWRALVSGIVFPYSAMVIAGAVAAVCRQSWPRALTVAIEVGIQNATVTLIVLRNTLGQPEADLASVVPVTCILMTPFPLFIGAIVRYSYQIWKRAQARNSVKDLPTDEKDKTDKSELDRIENLNGSQKKGLSINNNIS